MLALEAGSTDHSPDSAHATGSPVVLICRQRRGRIVNIWLVLIGILGAVIAFRDGLTRTPIAEYESYWKGALEYEPYKGALLVAGLSLPLMFAYVRSAKVPLNEGLFLWFVFCTAAYTRDFSYVRWPGTPLFVTDVVLLILLLSIYLPPKRQDLRVPLPVSVLLVLLVAAGMLAAVRGFLGHRDAVFVLRDFALVVYALYLMVAYNLLRSWLAIKRVAVWFLLGTSLSVLSGLGWFVTAPQERRFIYYGIYILIALVGISVAMVNGLLRWKVGWILGSLFCLGLLLANARSLFVSLSVLLFTGLFGGRLVRRKARVTRLFPALVTTTVLVSAVAFLVLRSEAGRDFAERSVQELVSGVTDSGEDANWQFRVSAWKEAWKRFEEYPLGGEGFGVPFVFDLLLLDNDPRPHNTFLTVLYKMGLIGFLPLLALLVCFLWQGLRAVRRNLTNGRVGFLQIMLLAQVAFCLYGSANLLLESPFLASLFWTAMGLSLRMIEMLDVERLWQKYGHQGKSSVPRSRSLRELKGLWGPANI